MPVLPSVAHSVEEASAILQYHRVVTTAKFKSEQKEVNTPKELKPPEQKPALTTQTITEAEKSAENQNNSAQANPYPPELGQNIDLVI